MHGKTGHKLNKPKNIFLWKTLLSLTLLMNIYIFWLLSRSLRFWSTCCFLALLIFGQLWSNGQVNSFQSRMAIKLDKLPNLSKQIQETTPPFPLQDKQQHPAKMSFFSLQLNFFLQDLSLFFWIVSELKMSRRKLEENAK